MSRYGSAGGADGRAWLDGDQGLAAAGPRDAP